MNNISFQGHVKYTQFIDGVKLTSIHKTSKKTDELIKNTVANVLGYYNFNNFRAIRDFEEAPIREVVGNAIRKDLKKKDYFESAIVAFGPSQLTFKEMNRVYKNGFEFEAMF